MVPGHNGVHPTILFVMYGRLANLISVHTRYVPFKLLHRTLSCECPI